MRDAYVRKVREDVGMAMTKQGQTWALVLAAGEGRRLRRLTRTETGVSVPAQFCSLYGVPSLLEEAIRRVPGRSSGIGLLGRSGTTPPLVAGVDARSTPKEPNNSDRRQRDGARTITIADAYHVYLT